MTTNELPHKLLEWRFSGWVDMFYDLIFRQFHYNNLWSCRNIASELNSVKFRTQPITWLSIPSWNIELPLAKEHSNLSKKPEIVMKMNNILKNTIRRFWRTCTSLKWKHTSLEKEQMIEVHMLFFNNHKRIMDNSRLSIRSE